MDEDVEMMDVATELVTPASISGNITYVNVNGYPVPQQVGINNNNEQDLPPNSDHHRRSYTWTAGNKPATNLSHLRRQLAAVSQSTATRSTKSEVQKASLKNATHQDSNNQTASTSTVNVLPPNKMVSTLNPQTAAAMQHQAQRKRSHSDFKHAFLTSSSCQFGISDSQSHLNNIPNGWDSNMADQRNRSATCTAATYQDQQQNSRKYLQGRRSGASSVVSQHSSSGFGSTSSSRTPSSGLSPRSSTPSSPLTCPGPYTASTTANTTPHYSNENSPSHSTTSLATVNFSSLAGCAAKVYCLIDTNILLDNLSALKIFVAKEELKRRRRLSVSHVGSRSRSNSRAGSRSGSGHTTPTYSVSAPVTPVGPVMKFIIPYIVLQELDGLKERDKKTNSFIRCAIKFAHEQVKAKSMGTWPDIPPNQAKYVEIVNNDDKILECACLQREQIQAQEAKSQAVLASQALPPSVQNAVVIILTNDTNLATKAMAHSVGAMSWREFCEAFDSDIDSETDEENEEEDGVKHSEEGETNHLKSDTDCDYSAMQQQQSRSRTNTPDCLLVLNGRNSPLDEDEEMMDDECDPYTRQPHLLSDSLQLPSTSTSTGTSSKDDSRPNSRALSRLLNGLPCDGSPLCPSPGSPGQPHPVSLTISYLTSYEI